MPRPVDAGGPAPPRPSGCACMACGEREHPRRPQHASLEAVPALQSLPRTRYGGARSPLRPPGGSGDASPLVFAVGSATTPPWTHDAIRGGGAPFPDRVFHPAGDAQLVLARQRQHSAAPASGSADGVERRRRAPLRRRFPPNPPHTGQARFRASGVPTRGRRLLCAVTRAYCSPVQRTVQLLVSRSLPPVPGCP